ncbi:hypothetical protein MGG_16937 [Pyricularia oryzae 70-15]|uniref:Uncharacterized protein n=1 Tax=Pyricularia oryzae (strain 70-15 / ATCC MYA-4617 / FGSC 8958) TaxID=242507 RepID=G4N1G8_PYRO7|nr:uncharacterized protein MGG_16937 [Pyricularia oryzae 70-15]EHA53235.1 hypothetical protein MGG_16937 [Pyricularia oryzae 70-15]
MSILWPLSVNLESTEQLHSALTINYQARSADPVTARRVARYSPCSPKTPERSSASYVLTTANGSPRRTTSLVLAPGLRGPVFDIGAGQQGVPELCSALILEEVVKDNNPCKLVGWDLYTRS